MNVDVRKRVETYEVCIFIGYNRPDDPAAVNSLLQEEFLKKKRTFF